MFARRSGFVALVTMVALVALGLPLHAAPQADGSRDPMTAAEAMAADPSTVLDANLESTTATAALMEFNTDDYNGFPSGDDDSFMALASGDAALMNDGDQSYFASGSLGGLTTNTGTDLAGMTTEFSIPQGVGTPCFIVDLKFMSEEFPEYVGSSYNDFVVGRINNTAAPTIDMDLQPVAEGNFLVDGGGQAITVNNNYNVNASHADQTVYDGATPTLQARSEVPDTDTFTFSVWIADVGDSIFDSMVFLDNAQVVRSDEGCESGTSGPSATTVKAKIKGSKVKVSGTLIPSDEGAHMVVTLYKKVGSKFNKLSSKNAFLSAAVDLDGDGILEGSTYTTSFGKPSGGGTCKVKAKYPGDSDTYPSSASKKFSC